MGEGREPMVKTVLRVIGFGGEGQSPWIVG